MMECFPSYIGATTSKYKRETANDGCHDDTVCKVKERIGGFMKLQERQEIRVTQV
jgi:hypothetical protein